jgi:hypothetical protein
MASEEETDDLRQRSLRTLEEAAEDLKRLTEREQKDKERIGLTGLEMGKVLCEVLDRPMSVWDVPPSKLPDGQLQTLASWAKRTAGLRYERVAQLTRAHRVAEVVFTRVKTRPTSERQLRPLTGLLNSHREEIPAIWKLACERAKRMNDPSAAEVKRAAKERIPDAFPKDKKTKAQILKSVRALRGQAKDKGSYRAALEAALKELDV